MSRKNKISNLFKSTWVVRHPNYVDGKYRGIKWMGGKEYYLVEFNRFTQHKYDRRPARYTLLLLKKDCKLVRLPGKIEKFIRNIFTRKPNILVTNKIVL